MPGPITPQGAAKHHYHHQEPGVFVEVGDNLCVWVCVGVKPRLHVHAHVDVLVEGGRRWNDTCQRNATVTTDGCLFYSQMCLLVCLCASTPVISPPLISPGLFAASCGELQLPPPERQQGTSQDFGHSLYSLHLAPSHSASK